MLKESGNKICTRQNMTKRWDIFRLSQVSHLKMEVLKMKNNKVISKVISGTLLCSMVGYTLPVFAYTKDETVY